ncbi:MAG: hypothetical protein FE78DRAFT_396878 [Acidomyces sp. 'richmondensis']|nr:MAG: hypothetical protein FE78DRAFT_396878 [Acidomyces sp. 'richmondensis']
MLIMPPLQHPLIIIAIPSTQAATATSTSSYPARRHCWRRQHLAVPPPGLAHGIPEACPSLLRPAGHILAKLRTDGTAWCNHRPGFQTESQIIYTLSNELRGADPPLSSSLMFHARHSISTRPAHHAQCSMAAAPGARSGSP